MSREQAFVIGGFSESPDYLSPLTNEVATQLFSDVEQFTWHQAYRRRHMLAREAVNRTIITHSAGAMFLHDGVRAIALAGVEPTPPEKSILRAGKVAFNMTLGHEKGSPIVPMLSNVEEVLRHPTHLRVLGQVGWFSTTERLVRAGDERFPEGRLYLPALDDEFGFGKPEAVARATANGITAAYVGRFHNYPLTHPKATVQSIRSLIEQKVAA